MSVSYFVYSKVEDTIEHNAPNCNVCENACTQAMSIDCNRPIPEQGNKAPGQGARHNRDVNAWMAVVAEMKGGEIEEVDYEDKLSPVEMSSHEEHDEGELEEVV